MTFRPLLLCAVALVAVALWLGSTPAVAGDPPPADPGMGDPGMASPPPAAPPANPPPADPGMADPAKVDPKPVNVAEAQKDLDTFKQQLKDKKTDTGDQTASLKAVFGHYQTMLSDPETYKAWLADAEAAFLRAFWLTAPKNGTNLRDDLNVEAAKVLGQTRPHMTAKLIERMEAVFFKAKEFTPPETLFDEAFKAIGLLSDRKDGLPYLTDWIKYDNTADVVPKIRAAFDALAVFKDLTAKDRLGLFDKALTVFMGVEHAAEVNKTKEQRAQKEVWDKIKTSVVKTMQILSKSPKGADGNVLATIKGFWEWFQAGNDKLKREPWVDPPKVAPGAPPVPAGAAPPAGK